MEEIIINTVILIAGFVAGFNWKKNKKMQTGVECEECKEGRQWNGVNFCMKCGTDLRR